MSVTTCAGESLSSAVLLTFTFQLLIETIQRSNKYYFIIFKLLVIVPFHTTGGSDEGQDWELTKVGGSIECEKTVIHPSIHLSIITPA